MRQRRIDRPTPEEREIGTMVNVYTGKAHKDQRGIQIFIVLLDKVVVVLVGGMLELLVELIAGAFYWLRGILKESLQCFERGILQSEVVEEIRSQKVQRGRGSARRTLLG